MQTPNYRVNPSLLGKFSDYLNSDSLWSKFYGDQEEPAMSPTEFSEKQERELIDAINRVDKGPIEAADRGTALNEIIDCTLEQRQPDEKIQLATIRDESGKATEIDAKINGFEFRFDADMCLGLIEYFRGSTCQHLCEAIITTLYGPVVLYGYSDYIFRDVVKDLKTTTRYEWGKYEGGWQKDLYPWCLIESGEVDRVSGFEYTVVKLSGGTSATPIIGGEMFREWYDYNHAQAEARLRDIVERFIGWIEMNRDKITHPRIFNQ